MTEPKRIWIDEVQMGDRWADASDAPWTSTEVEYIRIDAITSEEAVERAAAAIYARDEALGGNWLTKKGAEALARAALEAAVKEGS